MKSSGLGASGVSPQRALSRESMSSRTYFMMVSLFVGSATHVEAVRHRVDERNRAGSTRGGDFCG
jgi:hypothetical protein